MELIEITAEPPADPERVNIARIGDDIIDMVAVPPRGWFLAYMTIIREQGYSVAVAWALRQMLGREHFAKVIGSGMDARQMDALTTCVLDRLLGITTGPKGPELTDTESESPN